MVIDTILALHDLDRCTAGFLVDELFAHGQLDTRQQVLTMLRQGIHRGESTQRLLEMLKWPKAGSS